jgi:2-haloacid dehalogenase
MSEIKRRVNRMLDSKRAYALWLEVLLHYTLIENSTAQYHDFESIARAALDQAALLLGSSSSNEMKGELLHLMKHLPLRDGVQKGLSHLKDQGFRLAVFTNTPQHILRERMEPTGLISYFEAILSVDEIRKFKPAMECYQWALNRLEIRPEEAMMVTAHGWDICGAMNAGMGAAFIKHEDAHLYPFSKQPDFTATDLTVLATMLEKSFQRSEMEK